MIIWGSKTRKVFIASGTFHCPICNAERPYKHQRLEKYNHIYFIPLNATKIGDFIECDICHKTFTQSNEGRLVTIDLSPRRESPQLVATLLIGGVLLGSLVFIPFILMNMFKFATNQVDSKMLQAAGIVCNSGTLTSAATYNPKVTGVHPIFVMYTNTESPWARDYPQGWLPSTADQLQLVGCGKHVNKIIENCKYKDSNGRENIIKRTQWFMEIQVFEAQTGKLIESFTVDADPPRECRQQEKSSEYELEGSKVSNTSVMERLKRVVAP